MTVSGSTFLSRPAQPDPEIAEGTVLGSYKLEDQVGAGAMGRVFKARHQLLNRTVAIKVLHPEYANREDVVQRFFQEARVVNEINHEHIVEVTDFVEESRGRAYCVMEFLQGRSLRDAMSKRKKKKRISLQEALRVMVQVCNALHAAHERGVVHRDLKPDNIFLIERGGTSDYVKVLDFGVAKLTEPLGGAKAASTVDGMIVGTPIYMSPEQASGFEVDRRTDVWAAGVILYEFLAGKVPFDATAFVELANKIIREAPAPLPSKTPRREKIPAGLSAVVLKCLKKKPDERYATMDELAEALEPFAGLRRRSRSRGLLAPLAAGVVLAAGGYAAVRAGLVGRAVERLLAPNQRPVAAPSQPVVPAPAPVPAPPPAPKAETPPAPKPPTHVTVEFLSLPAKAAVTWIETGEMLGKTPLKVQLPRHEGTRKFRFAMEGYEDLVESVDLSHDGNTKVALRPLPPKHKASHGNKKKSRH